jgi:hypothetical protein
MVSPKLKRELLQGDGELAPAPNEPNCPFRNPSRNARSDLSDADVERILREHNLPVDRLLWFGDFSAAKLITSYAHLGCAIKDCGFPPGKYWTHKKRIWTGREIATYIHTRPHEPSAVLTELRRGRRKAAAEIVGA